MSPSISMPWDSHFQWKLQANPGRTADGPYTLGMRVWVPAPGEEPGPPEVLAEDKGNTEWVAEEGSYKY